MKNYKIQWKIIECKWKMIEYISKIPCLKAYPLFLLIIYCVHGNYGHSILSIHPQNIKRAIPYNLAWRIFTIVSDEETRHQRLNELKQFLSYQHYPINLINDGIRNAKEIDRQDLINPILRNNKETKILPLVTTHNPRNPIIAQVVSNLNGVLKTDEDMARVLSKFKFINSKRQPKNLKRILCSSTILY